MPSLDSSPPLLHPSRSFPKKILFKRLELEEVGRTASACGPQRCPGDASGAGVARSVGPFVLSRSFSSEGRAGTPGRVYAAAVASELYPQIKRGKKKKKERKTG